MLHGLLHRILLVIVLHLSVTNMRGTVVQHRQPGGTEGLAFAGLLQRADRGAKRVFTENVREGLLQANAQAVDTLAINQPCEILRLSAASVLPVRFPQHA